MYASLDENALYVCALGGGVVCATDYFIFIPIEPVGEKKEFL